MLSAYIKYVFIVFAGFYCYIRLLNLNITARNMLRYGIASVFIPIILCASHIYLPYITVLIMVISALPITLYCQTENIRTTIITLMIAFCFSYVLFLIASVLVLAPVYTIVVLFNEKTYEIIYVITTGVIQLVMIFLLFQIRRLKKGMPFLRYNENNIAVFISAVILFCISFYNIRSRNDLLFFVPIFFTIFMGNVLYIWWRKRITKSYIAQLRKRELEGLMEEIEQLKAENERLSAIIHKDNKLIPAMEMAVRETILSLNGDEPREVIAERAEKLLRQLETVSRERKGILDDYETSGKTFTATGIVRIDAMIRYMYEKARKNGVKLDFVLNGNIHRMTEDVIREDDIATLAADLVENAIIACSGTDRGNVLLSIGLEDSVYCISVYDNGSPFDESILPKLGQERITTHADSGGSGIGFMTLFEINRKYKASLCIDRTIGNGMYTKKISVRFDGRNGFTVE